MGPSQRRCAGLVRTWRVLVLLRAKPHTLDELADKLSVTSRTIRRDIVALQSVPLPIESRYPVAGPRSPRYGVQAQLQNEWFIKATPEWPAGERTPVADCVEARS
jgi:predicted DNA-binding transcriptional regulator YafY